MEGQEILTKDDIDAKVEYLFSHRFNHTLHAYIDIAGDLIAGTLLSQIMYWFSENVNKGVRTGIYKDGYYWIARRREDWMGEIRISKKQYDCAIRKLTAEGNELVEVRKYQFNGIPMTHIRPVTENINRAAAEWKKKLAESISCQGGNECNGYSPNGNMEVPQTVTSNYPKGEYGSSPNGNMEVPQRDNSYINIYNNIHNGQENYKENYEKTYGEHEYILSGRPDDAPDSMPESVPEESAKPKKSRSRTHPEEVKQIIEYFNRVCGTNYRYQSKATAEMINARLNEGYTVADFCTVIDKKHAEWHNNADQCKYLRPETLFRPSHFESYLNQLAVSGGGGDNPNGLSPEMIELYSSQVFGAK